MHIQWGIVTLVGLTVVVSGQGVNYGIYPGDNISTKSQTQGLITWGRSCGGGSITVSNYAVENCHSRAQCTFYPRRNYNATLSFRPGLLHYSYLHLHASAAGRTTRNITMVDRRFNDHFDPFTTYNMWFLINLESYFTRNETINVRFSLSSDRGREACREFEATAYGGASREMATISLATLAILLVGKSIWF